MVRFHHRWKRVCSAADTCCVKSHSCCVHSIVTCYFLNAFGHFVLTIHCIIVSFRLTFANIKTHLYSLASDFLWLNWKIAVGLKINVIIIQHKLVGSASSSLLRITVYILHFYSLFRMMKNSEHTNPHWRIWRKPLLKKRKEITVSSLFLHIWCHIFDIQYCASLKPPLITSTNKVMFLVLFACVSSFCL